MTTQLDLRDRSELRRALAAMEDHAPPAPDLDRVQLAPIRPRLAPGWVIAATVAAIVLAVGVPLMLVRGGGEQVAATPAPAETWDIHVVFAETLDVDGLVGQVAAIEGVASVEYVSQAESAPQPEGDATAPVGAVATTAAGEPSAEDAAPTGTLLLRLGMGADAADVAAQVTSLRPGIHAEFSAQVAVRQYESWLAAVEQDAEVVLDDPLVIQPALGPEPTFDTSVLGTEVVLERPGDTEVLEREEVSRREREEESRRGLGPSGVETVPPVIHIGRLAETATRLVVFAMTDGFTCRSVLDPSGTSTGCDLGLNAAFGAEGGGYMVDDSGVGVGHIVVRVPVDTAVVTLSVEGGPPQWQRPAAGLALFPYTISSAEDSDTLVTAYDAAGNVIGSWENNV